MLGRASAAKREVPRRRYVVASICLLRACSRMCGFALTGDASKRSDFGVTFVHERKRKAIKRYANNLTTSTLSYEMSMLEDLLLSQIETLAEPSSIPSREIFVWTERRKKFVSQMATIDGLRVYSTDVCSFELESSEACGQVYCHVKIHGAQMTCVSRWTEQSLGVFDMTESVIFVPTRCIKQVRPFSVKDGRALVRR